MNKITNTPEAGNEHRAEWATPTLRRMRAGDAENAFTQARDDGQFTKS